MRGREYLELLKYYQGQISENPQDEFWKQELANLVKNQHEYDLKDMEQRHLERIKEIEVDAAIKKEVIQRNILRDRNDAILDLVDSRNFEPELLERTKFVGHG